MSGTLSFSSSNSVSEPSGPGGSPLFSNLCGLLQSIADQRGTEQKKRRLERFLYDWRAKYGLDVYEAMRLILPHLDKSRYNMKETKLAKVYTEALGLSRNSLDAYNLLKFKQPSIGSSFKYAKATGDFSAVAYDIIASRSTVQKPTQTVHDVNLLLDELSRSEGDEKAKVNIFKRVVNLYTPFEQKWLIRIILKDLKMGMTDNSALQVFHPQARELYAVCSNLKKVCEDLKNPLTKLKNSTIELFHPFKPQLGCREVPRDVRKVAHNGVFYIEEKIDGERIQMHYERKTATFMWYSRRSTDYTYLYGGSPTDGRLAGSIVECLKADSLILDGEMVAYDPKLDVLLPFGTLKSSAQDESIDPHKARPCFIVFDIVYCNGNPLLDYPLSDRIKILNGVVREKHGHLHLLPRQEKKTFQDIVEALDQAMTLRQEGLVIKNPGSTYEPGARNNTWIKLKPEYIDSLQDNCDLLVVGACYGAGRRGNRLSQFLCAIRDDTVPEGEEPRFMTFCMIGTGYTIDELEEFRQTFQELQRYDPRNQPLWLVHPEKSNENPDVIVPHYTKALVVEVKASEIIWGNMFGAGNTLRFPRFMRFRHDKDWKDILTYTEMTRARRAGTLSGNKRKASEQDFFEHKKKRAKPKTTRATRLYAVLKSQQGIDTSDIKTVSSLFEGLTFFVVSGDSVYSKADLEALIKQNGGDFTQQTQKADYVIAGTKTIRVNSIIYQGQRDVILPQWIADCVENQDMIPLSPKYMMFTTEETNQLFREKMDIWGGSYTQDETEQTLREVMDRIEVDNSDVDKIHKLMDEVHERYFQTTGIPGLMFQRVRAYLDDRPSRPTVKIEEMTEEWAKEQRTHDRIHLAALEIRFKGGLIVSEIKEGVTHVIMDKDNLERLPELTQALKSMPQPRFVTTEWVDACVEAKTMVDERPFEPKLPHSAFQHLT